MEPAQPLRRNRDFVLLWLGQLTSEFGTGLLKLAVLLHVYESTRSTVATTATFVAETAPWALVSPWAGALADRANRWVLLVGSDAVRAVILVPLLFDTRLPVLLTVLFAQAAVGTVFRPAYNAFLPAVVPAAQLGTANGFSSSTGSALGLVAPALGAALFATFGFTLIVGIDIVTFLVSIVTLLCVRARPAPREVQPRTTTRQDLVVAFHAVRAVPLLRLLFAAMLCFGLVEALISPLFVPFLQGTLHASATQVGFAASAQSFGTIGAGFIVVAVASRLGATRMFVVGAAGVAVVIVVFGLAPTYPIAVVAYAASGIPSMLTHVGSTTLLQTAVPDELRGRVNGGFNSMFGFTTLLAAAIPAFVSGL